MWRLPPKMREGLRKRLIVTPRTQGLSLHPKFLRQRPLGKMKAERMRPLSRDQRRQRRKHSKRLTVLDSRKQKGVEGKGLGTSVRQAVVKKAKTRKVVIEKLVKGRKQTLELEGGNLRTSADPNLKNRLQDPRSTFSFLTTGEKGTQVLNPTL
ncbi:uncharacterized protein BDR25DRAFT_55871 [Lindgomyces ingoldianus]|uniref:Uncharacterized protein n=1 Tax=Lindgomyces ingoldianus TaxID=673940 RepID=A0ACB6QNT0_9PLEO|nr:uncharacterized protein BDR25DRAFT_55871 [Lindgomyces ingoldianus]KAF2468566.1 hypothetical protein BDR25DRAFT_55871 [Lindgomyces ingoldianus]